MSKSEKLIQLRMEYGIRIKKNKSLDLIDLLVDDAKILNRIMTRKYGKIYKYLLEEKDTIIELDSDLIEDITQQLKAQNEDLKEQLIQQVDQILTESGEKIIDNFMMLAQQVQIDNSENKLDNINEKFHEIYEIEKLNMLYKDVQENDSAESVDAFIQELEVFKKIDKEQCMELYNQIQQYQKNCSYVEDYQKYAYENYVEQFKLKFEESCNEFQKISEEMMQEMLDKYQKKEKFIQNYKSAQDVVEQQSEEEQQVSGDEEEEEEEVEDLSHKNLSKQRSQGIMNSLFARMSNKVSYLVGFTNDLELKQNQRQEKRNGQVYVGEKKDGKRHGIGKLVFNNGSVYQGEFVEGMMCGNGKLVYYNGDVYEGQFEADQANGYGKLWSQGNHYEGQFKDDKFDGMGLETYKNKSYYKGQFKEGKKCGEGEYVWNDGGRYMGGFDNDMFEGYGEFQWKDGRYYKGHWKDNKMHGNGQYTWPNGNVYSGGYSEDKKAGYGEFYFANKGWYKGNWVNGRQDGMAMFLFANGLTKQGVWSNGKFQMWVS